jgi:hypothetical protein
MENSNICSLQFTSASVLGAREDDFVIVLCEFLPFGVYSLLNRSDAREH